MIQLLRFKIFDQESGVAHFVSTRAAGVSQGAFKGMNLSYKSGDDPEHVLRNRELLAREIGIQPDQLIFPDQCHTNRVKLVDGNSKVNSLQETDGLICHEAGLAICVLAADCVPILLYDPRQRVIAALHAGWRGTAKEIVSQAISKMMKEFNSDPGHILAGIGPAISQAKYETGEEEGNIFRSLFTDYSGVIKEDLTTGKPQLDLQLANQILLLRSGIKEKNIEVMKLCTFSHPELFFSARRDGFHSGRFAAGIMLTTG